MRELASPCPRFTRALVLTLALPLTSGLTSCAHAAARAPEAPPPPRSLFERLGGLGGIVAVVDATLGNIAADDRINYRFGASDLGDLRQKLVDQLCQATGGPCVYKGRDMLAAHKGLHVRALEFDALVADLDAALTHAGVADRERGELLGALAGFRNQILDDGAAAGP